jgi:hypothetical protein
MKYATVDFDRDSVGGIGEIGADQPAEMPPYWGTYFAVADTTQQSRKPPSWAAASSRPHGTALRPDGSGQYDQGGTFALMSTTEQSS